MSSEPATPKEKDRYLLVFENGDTCSDNDPTFSNFTRIDYGTGEVRFTGKLLTIWDMETREELDMGDLEEEFSQSYRDATATEDYLRRSYYAGVI